MRVLAMLSLSALVILAGGCTPANQPAGGEAIAVPSGPPPADQPPPVSAPEDTPAGALSWFASLSEAQEKSKLLDRPMLIDFYADWCGPCKELDEKTWPDAGVVKAAGRFVCARVDIDANKKAAELFRVKVIPTIVVMSPQGKVLGRAQGFQSPKGMIRFLDSSK